MYDHQMKKDKLTPHFLKALIVWQGQNEAGRSFDIKVEGTIFEDNHVMTIWCYDSTAMEGCFVTKITDIPTTKKLLEMKKASIEKNRADLEREMKALEEKV